MSWTSQTSGPGQRLQAVIHGSDQFIAAGAFGTVLTSRDGVIWSPQVSGTTNSLAGVTFTDDGYVAVGRGGTLLNSTDGTNWSPRIFDVTNSLVGIAHGNGRYVVVGGDEWIDDHGIPRNDGIILTSMDELAIGSPLAQLRVSQRRLWQRDIRGHCHRRR
jgi:photosystem II stability/assembly factor-like uncharacterized protein